MFIYEIWIVKIYFDIFFMNLKEIKCIYWDCGKCLCVYSGFFLVSVMFSNFN